MKYSTFSYIIVGVGEAMIEIACYFIVNDNQF